jgi:hypothetical protein
MCRINGIKVHRRDSARCSDFSELASEISEGCLKIWKVRCGSNSGVARLGRLPPTTDIHRVDTRSEHPLRERVRPCCAAKHAWIASTAIAICGPTSSTVSASSVDVGGSIPLPPPPPGRVMRAYQTTGHLPVAVAHAFVLIRPTSGVVTSAYAICGLIPTPRGCHCFRR